MTGKIKLFIGAATMLFASCTSNPKIETQAGKLSREVVERFSPIQADSFQSKVNTEIIDKSSDYMRNINKYIKAKIPYKTASNGNGENIIIVPSDNNPQKVFDVELYDTKGHFSKFTSYDEVESRTYRPNPIGQGAVDTVGIGSGSTSPIKLLNELYIDSGKERLILK